MGGETFIVKAGRLLSQLVWLFAFSVRFAEPKWRLPSSFLFREQHAMRLLFGTFSLFFARWEKVKEGKI